MPNSLITPKQWLERSDVLDWALFDCRFNLMDPGAGLRAYQQGHIPGAQYAHLNKELSGPIGPDTGRHPLPDPNTLADRLGAWGVGQDTRVVCYDDQNGAIAARLWWLLRWLGHDQVAVMEGGWTKWLELGYPLSTDVPEPEPTKFDPQPNLDWTISTQEVERLLRTDQLRLLDCRSDERFLGLDEPIDPVAGHIPGAVNTPLWDNMDEQGTFLPPDQLHAYYATALQGTPPDQAAIMCGSGVTACHTLLALEIAKMPGAKLYVGSWSEWIRDPRRPIACTT